MRKYTKLIASVVAAAMLAMIPMSSYAAFGFVKADQTAQAADESYTFVSGTTVIKMGANAAEILKALGNPVKPVIEMDSCAYQGKEKVYTYPGFELGVGPADGKTEVVTSIFVLDNTVATPEGIKFGSAAQDVTKAYGAPTSEAHGVLHYIKANTEMIIYETASKVDGIEYIYKMK